MAAALTEKRNPDTINIDQMDSLQILQALNNEDKKVALAIEKILPDIAKAVDTIADCFSQNGRMAYFGAGTSGRIAILDAADCASTFGIEDDMVQAYMAGVGAAAKISIGQAEDSEELGIADLSKFSPTANDIVVGLSASGGIPYILGVLKAAQDKGVKTIGISSNPDAKLKVFSDIFLNPLVGEEAVAGSSRLKSGTAQKLILNMLSTAAMIRIGKTYENYMVDVKISNDKLYARACSIISSITGVDNAEAKKCLAAANNQVKTACVIAHKKCSADEARKTLEQSNGALRKIIPGHS